MAFDLGAAGQALTEQQVVVCVSAWMEDHPSPLRVVIRVVEANGSMTTLSSTSVDQVCAVVHEALTVLAARSRRPSS